MNSSPALSASLVSRPWSLVPALLSLVLSASISAQTIYVPGGTLGTSNGNAGIGTSTPGAKLEVIGGATSFGLIVEGDGSTANARIGLRRANSTSATGNLDWIGSDNSVGARIGVNDDVAGSMAFKLGGSSQSHTRLFISSAGNVGIGTTVAGTALVLGSGTLTIKNAATDSNGLKLWQDTSDETKLFNHYSGPLIFGTANTERVRIDASGNVGIGTTSPGAPLHVKHSSGNLATRFEGYTNAYSSKLYLSSVSSGDGGILYDANVNQMDIFSYGDLRFNVGTANISGSVGNERMRITQSGGVGIGTANIGSYKLAVEGAIRARSVVVDSATWPDYVFEDSYQLSALSEVERFIKEKKHLPGIPSAAEVEAGGVSLGDMQARLLAKVEELTLHLIRVDKDNAVQAARIAGLEQENANLQRQLSALGRNP